MKEIRACRLPCRYFLSTVILNSLEASLPFVGCPVALTAKSPSAASSAALTVSFASVSPCLMTGPAGSMVTPLGKSENFRVTSWSKFFPRLMPIDTALDSPCLTLVARFGGSSVNVSSARPTTGLLSPRLLVAPGPPGVLLLLQPAKATLAAISKHANDFFIDLHPFRTLDQLVLAPHDISMTS